MAGLNSAAKRAGPAGAKGAARSNPAAPASLDRFGSCMDLLEGITVSSSGMLLFTGNSNPELVEEIAGRLNQRLGRALVSKFSDGEVMVEIMENIRGCEKYDICKIKWNIQIMICK